MAKSKYETHVEPYLDTIKRWASDEWQIKKPLFGGENGRVEMDVKFC